MSWHDLHQLLAISASQPSRNLPVLAGRLALFAPVFEEAGTACMM